MIFPVDKGSKRFPAIAPMITYTATRTNEKMTVGDRRMALTPRDPPDSEADSIVRYLPPDCSYLIDPSNSDWVVLTPTKLPIDGL